MSGQGLRAVNPADLIDRAHQIVGAAYFAGRELTDLEAGRVDELLDIVESCSAGARLEVVTS